MAQIHDNRCGVMAQSLTLFVGEGVLPYENGGRYSPHGPLMNLIRQQEH
ncbi:hypothetical protein BV96_00183 [Sphingomonas paucimobilis]|nr:hypothetical protein BV96_00183 [Sphingomonas paucimobilis]